MRYGLAGGYLAYKAALFVLASFVFSYIFWSTYRLVVEKNKKARKKKK